MYYLVKKRCYFDEFRDSLRIGLIQLFGIKLDSGLNGKKVDNIFHELDSIFFFVNIIRDIGLVIVLLCKPVQDISNQLKVGFGEVFERNDSCVVKRTKHLAESTAFTEWHLKSCLKNLNSFVSFKIIRQCKSIQFLLLEIQFKDVFLD